MFGTKCLGGRTHSTLPPRRAAPRPARPAPRPLPVHYIQVQVVGPAVQHAAALGAQRRQVAVEDGRPDPAPRRHGRRRASARAPPPRGGTGRAAPPPTAPSLARAGRAGRPGPRDSTEPTKRTRTERRFGRRDPERGAARRWPRLSDGTRARRGAAANTHTQRCPSASVFRPPNNMCIKWRGGRTDGNTDGVNNTRA